MKYITIPKLSDYQHYKDRNIVWIKLYCNITDDYDFSQLENDERWIFCGLLMIAAQNQNKIVYDLVYLTHRICKMSDQNVSRWYRRLDQILTKMSERKLIFIGTEAEVDSQIIADAIRNAIPRRRDKKRREEKGTFNKFKRALDKYNLFKRK